MNNNLRDDTEPWKDKDVYFWVPKEPEQVLVENRITSTCRVEEGGIKIAISKQYSNCAGQNGER